MTTVVVTVALSWAGWRLLNQQRVIDEQRTADSLAAAIRGKLAETGDKLSAALANPDTPSTIADAVVLTVRPDGSAIAATGALPFVPKVQDASADDSVFADGQALEFAQSDPIGAAGRYRLLTSDPNPAIRAGAWLRLGRVALKREDAAAALRAYQQLAELGDVRVEQLPARFLSLYQQREIAVTRGDASLEHELRNLLVDGLTTGKWLLTRGQAKLYRDRLGITAAQTWPLAEAIERRWNAGTLSAQGQRVFSDGSRSILVMWRTGTAGAALMASVLDTFLPTAPDDTRWQLMDPQDGWIAGERIMPSGSAPARTVGDADFPWTLRVATVLPLFPQTRRR